MNHIKDIGIEIEAAVDRTIQRTTDYMIVEDGSIHSDIGSAREVVTKPFKNMSKMRACIKDIYKHIVHTNTSMGVHLHIMMKKDHDYYRLQSYDFVKYFEQKIVETASPNLLRRLENTYSKKFRDKESFMIHADKQSNTTGKPSSRYHMINYCYKSHGTIEFRIFDSPKNCKTTLGYIKFLTKTVNDYLKTAKKLEPIKDEYSDDQKMVKVVI